MIPKRIYKVLSNDTGRDYNTPNIPNPAYGGNAEYAQIRMEWQNRVIDEVLEKRKMLRRQIFADIYGMVD